MKSDDVLCDGVDANLAFAGSRPVVQGKADGGGRKNRRIVRVVTILAGIFAVSGFVSAYFYWTLEDESSLTIKHDPIEKDPRYARIFEEADRFAFLEVQRDREATGLLTGEVKGECHSLWRIKKSYLWKVHGINWKSPAEMNPTIAFD